MTKYILILFATLFLASCGEDIIEQSETTEVIKTDVDSYVTGKVTDVNGNPIADVQIQLIQNREIIGEITSDSDGSYSTLGEIVDLSEDLILAYTKESYSQKFRTYDDLSSNDVIEKDVTMGQFDSSSTDSLYNLLFGPLDSTFVKIYGYAKYADGSPAEGVSSRAVWDFTDFGGLTLIRQFGDDYSDSDGYWEIYVAKDKEVFLQSLLTIGEDGLIFGVCQFNMNPDFPPTSNALGDRFVDLGSLSEDTEIFLSEEHQVSYISSTISGIALDCNGSPITAGNVAALFAFGTVENPAIPVAVTSLDDYTFGPNGEFEITLTTCEKDFGFGLIAEVIITDTISNFSGRKAALLEENIDMGSVQLCENLNDFPDEMTLNFDSETIAFDSGDDNISSGQGTFWTGFSFVENDILTSFFLGMEDFSLGNNDVAWLRMWKSEQENNEGPWTVFDKPFDEEPPQNVIATITDITDNWVTGSLSGTVETDTGPKPISANFRIYDK